MGSAYAMVWRLRGVARGSRRTLGRELVHLGHEHAEFGSAFTAPNAVILNSDHAHGVYLPMDLARCTGRVCDGECEASRRRHGLLVMVGAASRRPPDPSPCRLRS